MFKIETTYENGHQKVKVLIDPEFKDYIDAARILLGEQVQETTPPPKDEGAEYDT